MNNFAYFLKHRTRHGKRDTAQLAAQLAPAEEQSREVGTGAIQEAGAIIVNNDLGKVSNEIVQAKPGRQILGMEPVVLAILVMMLVFISFIAWQISQMPD